MATSTDSPAPLSNAAIGGRFDLILVMAMAVACFGLYLIGIGRQDLSNASENAVVQTSIEIRQGGPIWIPTMQGVPRILKPPLAAWIAAAGMRPSTLAATATGDLVHREAAFRQLAFEARWPSALTAAATLVIVFLLGRLLAGRAVGFASAMACASTLLFLRFGLMANTDIQLTLWVVCANLCLALILMRGWWLRGCAGAGLFLGLALMSKGPVGILQSVVPFLAFAAYSAICRRVATPAPTNPVPTSTQADRPAAGRRVLAVLLGVLCFAAISLPWPVSVLLTVPGAMDKWIEDVFHAPGTSDRPWHWWGYISLLPNTVPWLPLLIAGLCMPFIARLRRHPMLLAWFLLVVPIILMSFVRDKNERYGLPMVPAAALLIGYMGVDLLVCNRAPLTISDRFAIAMQWIVAIGMAALIPVAALSLFGNPAWCSWPAAVTASGLALAIILGAFALRRRIPALAFPAIAAVGLTVYGVAMFGYADSAAGRAADKDMMIRASMAYPTAQFLFCDPRPDPRHIPTDMAIYANRPIQIAQLNDLGVDDRPRTLFVLRQTNEDTLSLPGWTFTRREPVENRWYDIYVSP